MNLLLLSFVAQVSTGPELKSHNVSMPAGLEVVGVQNHAQK